MNRNPDAGLVARQSGWRHRTDDLAYLGLVALLVASTLNGVTVDIGWLDGEITIRPDQVVLIPVMPVVAAAWFAGRYSFAPLLFDWVVVAFLVSNLAASLLSSPFKAASVKAVVLLAGYVSMYFVVRGVLANRVEWIPLAMRWVCRVGVTQAAFSLVAVVLYWLGWPIGGLQIGHLSEASVATKGAFWEANLFGSYLALIGLLLAVRYLFESGGKHAGWHLAGLFITSLALPLTVTRAAGVAFAGGILVVVLLAWLYRSEIPGWAVRTRRTAFTLSCAALLTVTAMDALASTLSRYPGYLLERWVPLSWIPHSDTTPPPAPNTSEESTRPTPPSTGTQIVRASRKSVSGRLEAWAQAVAGSRDGPILGHGTLAGSTVIQDGWWYSSLVQALYDTGFVGMLVVLWFHVGAILQPIRTWVRIRGHPVATNLLGFGLGSAVIFFSSQFSSSLFVGFPWVFVGLAMGAVAALGDPSAGLRGTSRGRNQARTSTPGEG